jgi:hypothetical protein
LLLEKAKVRAPTALRMEKGPCFINSLTAYHRVKLVGWVCRAQIEGRSDNDTSIKERRNNWRLVKIT